MSTIIAHQQLTKPCCDHLVPVQDLTRLTHRVVRKSKDGQLTYEAEMRNGYLHGMQRRWINGELVEIRKFECGRAASPRLTKLGAALVRVESIPDAHGITTATTWDILTGLMVREETFAQMICISGKYWNGKILAYEYHHSPGSDTYVSLRRGKITIADPVQSDVIDEVKIDGAFIEQPVMSNMIVPFEELAERLIK